MNARFIIVFFRSCYIMLPLILQEVSEKNSPVQRIAVLQGKCFAEIFMRYERGKALKVIADSLNKRRFRARKGSAFRVSSLNPILKNRKYIANINTPTPLFQKEFLPLSIPICLSVCRNGC